MDDGPMKSMIGLFMHSNNMARIGTRFINMSGRGQALKLVLMLRNTLINLSNTEKLGKALLRKL